MNAGEVIKLLEYRGIKKTEGNIKYLAKKYSLYNDVDVPRPGLNREKMSVLISAMSSPLRIVEIARQAGVSRQKLEYYIRRERVDTEKVYGIVLLKNKKDVERVKSFL